RVGAAQGERPRRGAARRVEGGDDRAFGDDQHAGRDQVRIDGIGQGRLHPKAVVPVRVGGCDPGWRGRIEEGGRRVVFDPVETSVIAGNAAEIDLVREGAAPENLRIGRTGD